MLEWTPQGFPPAFLSRLFPADQGGPVRLTVFSIYLIVPFCSNVVGAPFFLAGVFVLASRILYCLLANNFTFLFLFVLYGVIYKFVAGSHQIAIVFIQGF